jgi:hypothetical protein
LQEGLCGERLYEGQHEHRQGVGMDLNNLQLGTILSAAPLVLTAFLNHWLRFRAKRKERRREERKAVLSAARQVAVSPHQIHDRDQPAGFVRITAEVTNAGSLPIYDVFLTVHSKFLQQPAFTATHQLNPVTTLKLDEIVAAAPDPYPVDHDDRLQVAASFRDSEGYAWQRGATGIIRPPINARPYGDWRGLLMKIGGGLLIWAVIAALFFRWNYEEQTGAPDWLYWRDLAPDLGSGNPLVAMTEGPRR